MKTFLIIVAAIVTAAAIISAGLVAAYPWLKYKSDVRALISSEAAVLDYGLDYKGSLESKTEVLGRSISEAEKIRKSLITVIQNKPYSIPLNPEETAILEKSKEILYQGMLGDLITAFEIHKTEYGDYPSGNNAAIASRLLGDNPNGFTFLSVERDELNEDGEIVDPWGNAYPMDIGKLMEKSTR